VRTHRIVTAVVSCFVAVAVSLSAREPKPPAADFYSHGTTTCLQRGDGPGIRLYLENAHCEGKVSYPHLELDIRELPISVHKSITIGRDNWAFRCPTPKDSCQQALSGQVVLDHFEENAGREIPRTDGYYELRFNSGGSESGRFIVDCLAPCS
jgi:hypothetical protein